MTIDDIIALATEAGIPQGNLLALSHGRLETGAELLERFAAIVATKERNRIADEAKSIIKRAEARGAAALREALEEAPKSVRHPLTDKQILDLGPGQPDAVWNYDSQVYFARAIEHAHGIE